MPRPRTRGGPTRLQRWKLTDQVKRLILASVRAGAFPSVACEAAGIPRSVFDQWLEWGCPLDRPKGRRPHRLYTPLWQEVMEAKAHARLAAEMIALKEDPVAWLRSGPGKERPNDPGWSRPVSPVVMNDNRSVNVLLAPGMQGVFASILQVLAPFPEARAAVAEALAGAREPRRIEAKPASETEPPRQCLDEHASTHEDEQQLTVEDRPMRTLVLMMVLAGVIGCHRPKDDQGKEEAPDQTARRGQENATELGPNQISAKQAKDTAEDAPGEYDRTASSPIPKEKWNVDYAEKTWGIKLKQVKYIERVEPRSEYSSPRKTGEFRVLLEFTKDLTDKELTPLKPARDNRGYISTPSNVAFIVLDENSVPIGRISWSPVSAEQMTGVKGDAFWVVCASYSRDNSGGHNLSELKGVKRVDLRPTQR